MSRQLCLIWTRTAAHLAASAARREGTDMRGTVKWFSDEKGFGFISQDGGEDLFVHHTGILGTGFKSLSENQIVEFEVNQGPKGLQATNVRPV